MVPHRSDERFHRGGCVPQTAFGIGSANNRTLRHQRVRSFERVLTGTRERDEVTLRMGAVSAALHQTRAFQTQNRHSDGGSVTCKPAADLLVGHRPVRRHEPEDFEPRPVQPHPLEGFLEQCLDRIGVPQQRCQGVRRFVTKVGYRGSHPTTIDSTSDAGRPSTVCTAALPARKSWWS